MVIQEDAILHSEDVSSYGTTGASLTLKQGFIIYVVVFQSLRKMSIITTHLQYQ